MITIMFTCKGCGLDKHPLQVPARDAVDLGVWMKRLRQWVGDEHKKVSPNCRIRQCDLYIPLPPETEFVGQQIE